MVVNFTLALLNASFSALLLDQLEEGMVVVDILQGVALDIIRSLEAVFKRLMFTDVLSDM